jgi:hypothetical protein
MFDVFVRRMSAVAPGVRIGFDLVPQAQRL